MFVPANGVVLLKSFASVEAGEAREAKIVSLSATFFSRFSQQLSNVADQVVVSAMQQKGNFDRGLAKWIFGFIRNHEMIQL